MNPQTYGQRYALAIALGRPAPSVFDVGDVSVEDQPMPSSLTVQNAKEQLKNLTGAWWLGAGIGAAAGLAVGYLVGRKTR